MLARDLGLGRAERDLLSTEPRIEEITARGSPDKILTSRLTDDAPFRGEEGEGGGGEESRSGPGSSRWKRGNAPGVSASSRSRSRFRVFRGRSSRGNRRLNHVERFAGTSKLKGPNNAPEQTAHALLSSSPSSR